ncbi:MAG TPA: hypothetical protein VFB32_03745 [Rudaea sp.]|nr:hypothetical protein [Rudaea sp.]
MRTSTLFSLRWIAAAALAVVLAACGGRDEVKQGTSEAANAPASYDLTVAADKDGQFDFDEATIDQETLRGHIRYLNEIGRPVKTLLLKPGEKEKIKNTHVTELAGIARDLHLTAYVLDNDGHLKVVQIVQ